MKVENLASKNPSFDNVVKQSLDIEYNNIVNSPEEDGEINIENIEHETQEVWKILFESFEYYLEFWISGSQRTQHEQNVGDRKSVV